ncbi:hypothetical protein HPP92_025491 [Vanilla planifolia]|uniref:Protein kinase domain-containing protein n=1 Tax=Vanilla planifolia TaxID=51239 RepID=A0A835PME5_VANPL|nr:hypothetical protein HPP92_025491 [Vanilla planifolia]
MCKSQGAIRSVEPQPRSAAKIPSYANRSSPTSASASATSFLTTTNTSIAGEGATGSSSSRSPPSLASLRGSLTDKPSIYTAAEISAATSHPLATRLSSSSWRCSLRGRDTFILQRLFRGDIAALPALLVAVCKSHHRSLIYLVYDYAPGASLEACLHNPVNREFTPLSSWISRIQVAADLAKGLDYIHHHSAGGRNSSQPHQGLYRRHLRFELQRPDLQLRRCIPRRRNHRGFLQ